MSCLGKIDERAAVPVRLPIIGKTIGNSIAGQIQGQQQQQAEAQAAEARGESSLQSAFATLDQIEASTAPTAPLTAPPDLTGFVPAASDPNLGELSSITIANGIASSPASDGITTFRAPPVLPVEEHPLPPVAYTDQWGVFHPSDSNFHLRGPDFASASVTVPLPIPGVGNFVGIDFSGTADRYGHDYGSVSLAGGFPTVVGASLTGGWMVTGPSSTTGKWGLLFNQAPTSDQLSGMLSSWGGAFTVGTPWFLGGGVSGNNGGAAVQAGLVTPGVGAHVGYTWQLPTNCPTPQDGSFDDLDQSCSS